MLGKDLGLDHEFDNEAVQKAAGLLRKRSNELEEELVAAGTERCKSITEQVNELDELAQKLEDQILAFHDAEDLVEDLRTQVSVLNHRLDGEDELQEQARRGEALDGVINDIVYMAAEHDPRRTENLLLCAGLYKEAGDARYMAIDRALAPKPEPVAPPEKPKKRARRGKRIPKVHPRQMTLFTEVH